MSMRPVPSSCRIYSVNDWLAHALPVTGATTISCPLCFPSVLSASNCPARYCPSKPVESSIGNCRDGTGRGYGILWPIVFLLVFLMGMVVKCQCYSVFSVFSVCSVFFRVFPAFAGPPGGRAGQEGGGDAPACGRGPSIKRGRPAGRAAVRTAARGLLAGD